LFRRANGLATIVGTGVDELNTRLLHKLRAEMHLKLLVKTVGCSSSNGRVDNGCQAVLKTVGGKTFAGSNPVSSAIAR
tara:strand:+ start:470 stop:703 length:234 start_codon:yes stop_codon:yes gene_type:complete